MSQKIHDAWRVKRRGVRAERNAERDAATTGVMRPPKRYQVDSTRIDVVEQQRRAVRKAMDDAIEFGREAQMAIEARNDEILRLSWAALDLAGQAAIENQKTGQPKKKLYKPKGKSNPGL